MKEHHISVTKTARFYTLGDYNDNTKTIWFVLHGYGQLAQFFIKNFEVLSDGQTYVIAPEALSRFYLSGFSGRVGATWMTKEDRETEIKDYINYLDQLFLSLGIKENVKINVLGFSQGVATAYRWVLQTKIFTPQKFILWAGIFPPDMNVDFKDQLNRLAEIETILVYGKRDSFLLKDYKNQLEEFISAQKNVQVLTFDGEHEINKEALKTISN